MLSFLVLSVLVINVSQSEEKKVKEAQDDSDDIASKLSYPLTDVDPDVIKAYGESVNDAMEDFVNKKQSFTQLTRKICAKGEKEGKVIHVVDGVEYKSLGQYISYMNNFRDLFKTDSCKKSEDVEVETSVIDANTVKIRTCLDVVIDLDIGIYDASQNVNACSTQIFTFDDDMDLIIVQITSEGGKVGSLFKYILQSAVTTVLPEKGYVINNNDERLNVEKRLLANPIFVVAMSMIVCMTLFIGLCIGLAINVTSNNRSSVKEKVILMAESDEEVKGLMDNKQVGNENGDDEKDGL